MSGTDIAREDEEKTVGEPDMAPQRVISNIDAAIPNHEANSEFNPPDGGLRAWSQVVAAMLLNAVVWGYPSSFGVFQLYYVETMDLPTSQVSWIGSTQVFLLFFICSISGRLADAGYSRHTVTAGTFLVVLGTFMTSLATEYWQIFLSQGVCAGLGSGIAFMPAIAVVSSYFKRNRAFALAISAVGTSIGSLILPSTVQYLIPVVGFPWAVRVEGFVVLTICIVANLLLKPYLPPRRTGPLIEWGAFRELPYVLFSLAGFLNFYALYFGYFYINSFAREIIGFSSVDSVGVLLIMNAMGIPSRPMVGYLGDHYAGPINVYLCALFSMGVAIYAWAGVDTRTGMYIFGAFYGFIVGATQGMYIGALASLTKDPQKMGTRFGMVSTMMAFAVLAGPPTAGAIIERSGGTYLWAQVWGGTVAMSGALAALASRLSATGLKLKVKV